MTRERNRYLVTSSCKQAIELNHLIEILASEGLKLQNDQTKRKNKVNKKMTPSLFDQYQGLVTETLTFVHTTLLSSSCGSSKSRSAIPPNEVFLNKHTVRRSETETLTRHQNLIVLIIIMKNTKPLIGLGVSALSSR